MRNGVVAGMAGSLDSAFDMTLKQWDDYSLRAASSNMLHGSNIPDLGAASWKGLFRNLARGIPGSIDCYFSNTRDPGIKRWHNDVAEDDRFKHAMSDLPKPNGT